jgi:hypothetical protein
MKSQIALVPSKSILTKPDWWDPFTEAELAAHVDMEMRWRWM